MYEAFQLNLLGASRRCDNTVIEQLISLNESELASLPTDARDICKCIDRVLLETGLAEIQKPGMLPGAISFSAG